MASDLFNRAVRDTEAALRGLAASLPSEALSAELLLTPLARIGDALRLGIEIPQPIRRWTDGVPDAEVRIALTALRSEIGVWSLPEPGRSGADDPGLAFVVLRRDEAHSVVQAVRRIDVSKRRPAGDELAHVESTLAVADARLRGILSKGDVIRLLGVRAAMQPTWADEFGVDADGDDVDRVASGERWPDAIRQNVPSDEVVARYVTRGVLCRYVEGVAQANPVFAQDLALFIDTMRGVGEDVGIIARRWQRRSSLERSADPLQINAIPPQRLAAATGDESKPLLNVVQLGLLSPLDADSRVEVTSQDVTVHVYAEGKSIERVELDGTIATSPVDPGHWRVTARLRTGPLRLRVVASDGNEFSEELLFGPANASDEAR